MPHPSSEVNLCEATFLVHKMFSSLLVYLPLSVAGRPRMKENWYIILRSSVSGVEFMAESKHPWLAVLCSSPAPKCTLPRGFLVNGGQCKELWGGLHPALSSASTFNIRKVSLQISSSAWLYIVLDLNWNWSCDPFALKKCSLQQYPYFPANRLHFYFDPVSVLHQVLCQLKYPKI